MVEVFAGRIPIPTTFWILKKDGEQSLPALKSWPENDNSISIWTYLHPVAGLAGDAIDHNPSFYPNDHFTQVLGTIGLKIME